MESAKFIVFEGIDGSGKTTLSKMLHEYFVNFIGPSHWTCEPTNNPVGKMIRSVITHELVLNEQSIAALFLADRMDHIQHATYGMKNLIEKGTNVISDRYYLSSYAYHVPHVSLDWVIEANSICANLLKADVIFYIDIDVKTSLDRISLYRSTNDLFETEERITLVHDNYNKAIERVKGTENIVRINGKPPLDQVFGAILKVLGLK